jgi:hypothetical protein
VLNFFFYLVHMTLASLLGATWDTYRIGMINESTQTRRSKPDPEQSIEVIAVNMPGRKFRRELAEVPAQAARTSGCTKTSQFPFGFAVMAR